VALAHTLGMDLIAEGVETAHQLEQLRQLKVECGQGYYFSKPLPAAAAAALIAAWPNWAQRS
jgi:EAL domain-containing protein (putative c-di-GMP-specific phosphodiesterase class I)